MKIFLIRHGETVDNIAGLYAGTRDSQLTNYGVDQTAKLGSYLASNDVVFTHVFASPLIRAYQTAQAIHKHQLDKASDKSLVPEIVQVDDLIEQDFGYYEGKSFQARSSPHKSGRESHAEQHRSDPDFKDVESKESMGKRADAFLDDHLMPLCQVDSVSNELVVGIISHGMLLSTLWRRMLKRMSRGSVTVAETVTEKRGPMILEHLGGWSNTGYLELLLRRAGSQSPTADDVVAENGEPMAKYVSEWPSSVTHQALTFDGYDVRIVAIDSRAHLVGLKRQRGGIGRLAYDQSQRKLDSFFKRPKIE